jgi:hypothetical protein
MRTHRFLAFLLTLVLALAGLAAHAQAAHEPTVDEIYRSATHGDLAGARSQVDQVLASHPRSAKAHYIKAEIAARQNDVAVARSELQAAERLAPGLPFAKPEAVSALRSQIDHFSQRSVPSPSVTTAPALQHQASRGGIPLGGLLLIALIFIVGIAFLRSRMRAAQAPQPYPPQRLDQGFGRYDANMPPPGYGGVPPGAYPQSNPSLGSTIGRGLATGLAVGAGVVAAEEIGHRLFDHQGRPVDTPAGAAGMASDSSLARDAGLGAFSGANPNADMGGQDFGIADNGGWDDAGGGGDFGLDNGGGNDDWS